MIITTKYAFYIPATSHWSNAGNVLHWAIEHADPEIWVMEYRAMGWARVLSDRRVKSKGASA